MKERKNDKNVEENSRKYYIMNHAINKERKPIKKRRQHWLKESNKQRNMGISNKRNKEDENKSI